MSRRGTAITISMSVLVLAMGLALEAAKLKPDLAARAEFRCGTTDCATDRVRDDGLGPYANYYPATTEGASINGNGEFTLRFIPGGDQAGRFIHVDFGAPVPSPACLSAACNPAGVPAFLDVTDGFLRTNVVNSSGAELPGGMLGMTCGTEYDSRLLITIPDVGGYWVVRFYADAFPPSNFVKVTRTSHKDWTIEATGQSILLWNGDSKGRPTGPGQEGTYAMPFLIQVSVPTAPSMAGCS